MKFSEQQLRAIQTWDQGVAIIAGAGCGKTTTLVGKCTELLKRKRDARICAISFTEKSTADMREKLSIQLRELNLGEIRNHWVMTFHGFCARLIREFPESVGLDGEEQIIDESESSKLWEESTDKLWQTGLPSSIDIALRPILELEGVSGVINLITRVKKLMNFGVLEKLKISTSENSIALLQVAEWVISVYQQKKQRLGALDYDDLERFALKMMNQNRYQNEIQSRFDLILIDEFQDTNATQCKIAEMLSKPDFSNLVIVGDPKQSIYRFRDADVSLFYSFIQKLPIQVELSENYRSSSALLSLVNEVCQPLFDSQDLEYTPLLPKKTAEITNPIVSINNEDPNTLAAFLFSEVQKGVPWESFCILLPKIRGNENFIQGLLRAQVPLVIASGGLFWSDPRVVEIVSFLKFWVDSRQRLSAAQWLRSPWMNIDDAILDSWFTDPTKDLGTLFWNSDHFLAALLKPFRNRCVSVAEILRLFLDHSQLERELGWVVLSLVFRAEEYSDQGLSFERTVNAFNESILNKERESVFPQPSGQGAMTLMTVHGSKGLEFPRVILPDLSKSKASASPVLFWDNKNGVYLNLKDPEGERDRKSSTLLPWKEFERKADLQESMRLFYVALTRAQEQLVFCYDPLEIRKEEAGDHWAAWLKPEKYNSWTLPIESSFIHRNDQYKSANPQIPEKISVPLKRARYGITELGSWNECERFALNQVMGWVVNDDLNQEVQERQEKGTRIHEALAQMDFERLKKINFNTEPLERWLENSKWFQDDGKARAEFSFELQIGNSILVGAMDRLICREREAIILDYKVSESKAPIATWAEKYNDQLHWYAWAVQQMEPKYKGRVRAVLVRISEDQVEEYVMPLRPEFELTLIERLERIREVLLNPALVQMTPGSTCLHCPLKSDCPEYRQ